MKVVLEYKKSWWYARFRKLKIYMSEKVFLTEMKQGERLTRNNSTDKNNSALDVNVRRLTISNHVIGICYHFRVSENLHPLEIFKYHSQTGLRRKGYCQ